MIYLFNNYHYYDYDRIPLIIINLQFEHHNFRLSYSRALYERIVVLEQKSREQDIIIANMSEQINSNHLSMSKIAVRYCNGCYIWYLADFKNKINTMKNNHNIMQYSPGFFTSPNGYKFCIRFNLSPKDPNYVAILVHMMRTEYDNTLDWPFSGRISVSIVHPMQVIQKAK